MSVYLFVLCGLTVTRYMQMRRYFISVDSKRVLRKFSFKEPTVHIKTPETVKEVAPPAEPSSVETKPSPVLVPPDEPPPPEPVLTCGFCKLPGHFMKSCRDFIPVKRACSCDNYRVSKDEEFRRCDQSGFCAAGVVLYYKLNGQTQVLMIEETRGDKNLPNFIGGKRDFKEETPLGTALRELEEETLSTKDGSRLAPELVPGLRIKDSIRIWVAASKYALFVFEVDPKLVSIGPGEYNNELKWVPLESVRKGTIEIHNFARSMVTLLDI